jgi:sterol 3beta-glucosyltransferase
MKIGLQAWGSEGDIQPFAALAAGLVRAGHEVTLVATDNAGRDYSGLGRRFGYRVISVPNPQSPPAEEMERIWRQVIESSNPVRQAELIMKYGFDPATEVLFLAAQDLCASSDVVVGHFFVYPLGVAAEKAGVPAATVNIVHNCVPSAQLRPPGLPDLGRWFYPWGWKAVRMIMNRLLLPRVNSLRRREGLTPHRDALAQTWTAERLNLIAVSPTICNRPSDWESRHQVCGFLNPPAGLATEDLPAGLSDFLAAGTAPVYFTFGSMLPNSLDYIQNTARIWIAAIQEVGCRAIIQLPWDDLSVFRTPECIFKVGRAPYKKVFPKCSLVVHHGGAGTTQCSLLCGRPSVVVAHIADQFFWGSELERLGVAAKTLKRKGLASKKLAERIRQVLARPGMTTRADALGQQMAKEDGVENAVRLIERHLGGRPPCITG